MNIYSSYHFFFIIHDNFFNFTAYKKCIVWICPTGLEYTLSECFWEICGEKGEITYIYTVPLQYLYLETEQSDHTGWPIIPRTNDDFFLLEIL